MTMNKCNIFHKIYLFNKEQVIFDELGISSSKYKSNLLNEKELVTIGFEQHAEILSKVVKKGKKFYEVPISYNGRTHEEGKKIKFHHIFAVIFRIVIERFK